MPRDDAVSSSVFVENIEYPKARTALGLDDADRHPRKPHGEGLAM
jgi:hypothetical protein